MIRAILCFICDDCNTGVKLETMNLTHDDLDQFHIYFPGWTSSRTGKKQYCPECSKKRPEQRLLTIHPVLR